MAVAEYQELVDVGVESLLQVIQAYEEYPQFVDGCEGAQIKSRKPGGLVQVDYRVSLMGKDFTYTLEHRPKLDQQRIEWSLVDSQMFKLNSGFWQLEPRGSKKTQVLYSIQVEFKIPVPGMIINGLVKKSLPKLVASFARRSAAAVLRA